jgi:hypothetical protein
MRKLTVLLLTLAMFAFLVPAASGAGNGNSFVASLRGANEVPPADTNARGMAQFRVNDGELSYKLIVANIENVVAAHIHCAPAGANGAVGVTLFLGAPVSTNGILAQGPIAAPDAVNGCGWADLDDVIDALDSGDTYVNVHTLAILSGEIRGQIK